MQIGPAPTLPKRTLIGLLILLIAAALLLSRVTALTMWYSELWSIFHTSGTFQQVFDPDLPWPPGYYVLLYGWGKLVSQNEHPLKMIGALTGLLTVALIVRIGKRLHSWRVGWLAAFAFATSSYATYFMLELRANSLALLAYALATWLHLRWLNHPTGRRAVIYGLACAFVMYIHYFGLIVILLFGLHTLLTHWRLWQRWMLILIGAAVLCIPLFPLLKLGLEVRLSVGRYSGYFAAPLIAFWQALSAKWDALFALIVLLVVGGLVRLSLKNSALRAAIVWLAAWGVAIPLMAYLTRERFGFFVTGYLSLTLIGIYALLGLGLAALPGRIALSGAALLVILAFAPWQPSDHHPAAPPIRDTLAYLNQNMQPGDVLVIDPKCGCDDWLTWWYYERTYLPQGIPRAASGDVASRRVWYLVRQGSIDPAVEQSVAHSRIAEGFVGPWDFITTLYEGPPGPMVQVGDHIRFGGASVTPQPPYRVGEQFSVSLWWAVDQPLGLDYSISLRLVDGKTGQLLAQQDGPPSGGYTPLATSGWQPGEQYRDDRTLTLPFDMPGGDYRLRLIVYQWWDGKPLPIHLPDGLQTDFIDLGTIRVVSYNRG